MALARDPMSVAASFRMEKGTTQLRSIPNLGDIFCFGQNLPSGFRDIAPTRR